MTQLCCHVVLLLFDGRHMQRHQRKQLLDGPFPNPIFDLIGAATNCDTQQ
jgi:hypothetical protein